jgi:neutral ceramidase
MPSRAKRLTRRRVLLGGAAAGAGGWGGLVGPWPVDPTAAPDHPAAREAIRAAAALGEGLRRGRGRSSELQAGWAAQELDLEDWPLAGYGARRGARSAGERDPLFVRCVLLRTGHAAVLLVCADLLLIHPELARRVEERLAEAAGSGPPWPILFTATHTHCGPGAWGRNWVEQSVTGPYDPEATLRLADAIAKCAAVAAAAAEPVEWGWLDLEAPDHLRNRTVSGGPVDAALETLVLRRRSDGARALVTLFGAHATCLPASVLEYATDYPGHLVRALEESGAVAFAAFASGVVGSQAPRMPDGSKPDPARLGRSLAERILPHLEALPLRTEADLRAVAETDLPLPPLRVRLNASLRLAPPASRLLHPGRSRLAGLALDEHLWLGLPFELSGMLSPALRAHAAARGLRLRLSCFCGDYVGYVIPDDLYEDHRLYEAQMNFLGPGGGSFVSRLVEALVEAGA